MLDEFTSTNPKIQTFAPVGSSLFVVNTKQLINGWVQCSQIGMQIGMRIVYLFFSFYKSYRDTNRVSQDTVTKINIQLNIFIPINTLKINCIYEKRSF